MASIKILDYVSGLPGLVSPTGEELVRFERRDCLSRGVVAICCRCGGIIFDLPEYAVAQMDADEPYTLIKLHGCFKEDNITERYNPIRKTRM